MIHSQIMKDILDVHAGHYSLQGDYSVTMLLDPPRIVHLNKRHPVQQIDYDTNYPSLIGTAVHKYIEECLKRSESSKYRLEQRLFHNVSGRKVSGAFDILDEHNDITDIKTCKTWSVIFDPDMEKWTQQQNIYAFLLHKNGIEVNNLYIQAVYLDWIESMSLRNRDYPDQPDPVYKLTKWPYDVTEEFLNSRVELMKKYEETPDDELPPCSSKEMWEDPTKFACFKTSKAKRAARVFNTIDDAIRYIKNTGGYTNDSFIEIRHGRRKRCDKYCDVRQFCNHYRAYKARSDDSNLIEIIPYEQI